jgi:hypothetical protein
MMCMLSFTEKIIDLMRRAAAVSATTEGRQCAHDSFVRRTLGRSNTVGGESRHIQFMIGTRDECRAKPIDSRRTVGYPRPDR